MSTNLNGLQLKELGNTYCSPNDRFVVSLIVGYTEDELEESIDEIKDDDPMMDWEAAAVRAAVAGALDLTRDHGASETNFYVYDRETGVTHLIEQGDAEDYAEWGVVPR